MNQAEIYPQPTHSQNFYERWKQWVRRLFQQERHKVTPTDILTPDDPRVSATEQEGPNTESHGSYPRYQPDVRNVSRTSRTQSPYSVAVAQPTISSFATQFQGAHNFSISGHPTFTNIGVNNGVNNVNTVNNHGPIHVDNRDQQHYEINVETQYGDTNIGDGQHNGGGTYNFKGIPQ